jgi:hypothetical protein
LTVNIWLFSNVKIKSSSVRLFFDGGPRRHIDTCFWYPDSTNLDCLYGCFRMSKASHFPCDCFFGRRRIDTCFCYPNKNVIFVEHQKQAIFSVWCFLEGRVSGVRLIFVWLYLYIYIYIYKYILHFYGFVYVYVYVYIPICMCNNHICVCICVCVVCIFIQHPSSIHPSIQLPTYLHIHSSLQPCTYLAT